MHDTRFQIKYSHALKNKYGAMPSGTFPINCYHTGMRWGRSVIKWNWMIFISTNITPKLCTSSALVGVTKCKGISKHGWPQLPVKSVCKPAYQMHVQTQTTTRDCAHQWHQQTLHMIYCSVFNLSNSSWVITVYFQLVITSVFFNLRKFLFWGYLKYFDIGLKGS